MPAITEGTCQICFRSQKLSRGHLSLHGYHVPFGEFIGVCCGARHAPFEESCDRTKWYLNSLIIPKLDDVISILARLRSEPESVLYDPYPRDPNLEPITILNGAEAVYGPWKTGSYGQRYRSYIPSYKIALNEVISNYESELKIITRHRTEIEGKIASWKPGLVRPVPATPPKCSHVHKRAISRNGRYGLVVCSDCGKNVPQPSYSGGRRGGRRKMYVSPDQALRLGILFENQQVQVVANTA